MAWKGIGNVHSLLSQLQEIEYALSNLMIETILKIQTLTETKVFLLLENSNTKSRRYCGNKEMIENFEKSNFPLAPNCVDLEVRLDPKANILTERRRGNRKRRMNESVDESLPQSELLSIRHSSSKRVFRVADAVDESDEHLGSYDDNDQVVKNEVHSDEDPYPIEFDEFPGNVLSSKGFVEEDDYNNMEEEENDEDNNDDDFEDADYDPSDLAGRKNRRLAGSSGAKSKKMKALKDLDDPVKAFVKNSRENKLLTDVLYEHGTEMAKRCPYNDADVHMKEVKHYMRINMDRFLSTLPRFTKLKKKELPDWKPGRQGPVWYMKYVMRAGFKSYAPHFFQKSVTHWHSGV